MARTHTTGFTLEAGVNSFLHNESHHRAAPRSLRCANGLFVFLKKEQANKPTENPNLHLIQQLDPKKVRCVVSEVRLNVHVGAVCCAPR